MRGPGSGFATNPSSTAGVVSFDTRVGAVTLTKADVTGTGLTATDVNALPQPFVTAVKTGAYTAAAGDYVPCDVTGGSFTVTLPTAPANRTRVSVQIIAGAPPHTLTVAAGGADVFELVGGAVTDVIPGLQSRTYQYKTALGVWYAVAGRDPNATSGGLSPTGTPLLGQVPVATSPSAAAWGYPAPRQSTTLQDNVTMDTTGPVLVLQTATGSAFCEHPTILQIGRSLWLAAWRYVASGSDSTGTGIIQACTFTIDGGTPGLVSSIFTLASDPVMDCRGPHLDYLADGRIFLQFTTDPPATGNPVNMNNGSSAGGTGQTTTLTVTGVSTVGGVSTLTVSTTPLTASTGWTVGMYVNGVTGLTIPAGLTITAMTSTTVVLSGAVTAGTTGTINAYATNPDGLTGNNRYMLCTASADPTTLGNWTAQHTIVSGFTLSATAFDSTSYSAIHEPSAGTIVLMVAGSNGAKTWDNKEIIGYQVGTYTAGTGTITWGTYQTIIDGSLAGATLSHTTGEGSLAVTTKSDGTNPAGSWAVLYRDSASKQAWRTVLPGPVTISAGVATGSGGWTAPAVASNQVYSQPEQTVLSSGTIVFAGRGTYSSTCVLASSYDAGATWFLQACGPDNAHNGWSYGQIRENAYAPGQIVMAGTWNSGAGAGFIQVICGSDGGGVTPFGGIAAASVSTRKLYIAPSAAVPAGMQPFAQTGDIGAMGLWGANRPLREYADMRTDKGVKFQNLPSAPLYDPAASYYPGPAFSFTPGVLYLWRWAPDMDVAFRYFYLHTGATAPSVTGAYLGVYRSSYALLVGSTNAQANVAANAAVQFDLASTTTMLYSTTGWPIYYLGLLFVGTTAPSVIGVPTPVEMANHAWTMCGTYSSGLSTLPATAGAPTASSHIPFVEASTN